MKLNCTLLLIVFLNATLSIAQQPIHVSVKNTTLAATDSLLPFWLFANRDGKVRAEGSWLNLTDLYIGQSSNPEGSAFTWSWGVNGVAAFGETSYYQLNQAFGGLSWKGWELTGGLFHDPTHYAGLSTTNGNLARSRNARPYPKLRLATVGYKPVPFLQNRLLFKAEYNEGLLNDQRFVDNTRMHHKSLYLRVPVSETWKLEAGLEHFVMWGGTSPVEKIGKMPDGFNAYLRYITGSSGDESFPETDQLNVAGNQLGTYQFKVTKQFLLMDASFYLSHPFEDFSGMNWRNWPDNLLGLHIRFNNRQQFITDVVYEYTNTRQQSIRDSFYVYNEETGRWASIEDDNYFNHSVYRSGYTYHQQVMSSPLFFPVILNENGAPTGFRAIQSTRFYAHHLGVRGNVSESLRWKGMLTWIHHFGSYPIPYNPSRKQLSGLMELHYINPQLPFELGLSAAGDAGNTISRNLGFQFWIARRW